MASIDDIFSLRDEQSLVRRAFRDEIRLDKYDLPTFTPDGGYTVIDLNIGENQDTLDYHAQVADICKEGRHTGKHEKLHSGVFEAIRNAYQHGNKKDPSKKVSIAYKAGENSFEVVVSDEGGELNPHFPSFVLLHRQGSLKKPVSFYDFASSVTRGEENSGIGTYVIHMVADEVQYLKNAQGGLSVRLLIYGPQLPLFLTE